MSASHVWAVQLDAFGKSYASGWTGRRRWAVANVCLGVAPGQILGLLGPNGSGKSTVLKAVAGLQAPTCGAVRIFGHQAGTSLARARVGYLPEWVRFPGRQSGRELLRYCAGLSGLTGPEREERCRATLQWAGLAEEADRAVAGYSKGMRQRLGLAQAIVHAPDVVVLDEPASGLDPGGRLEVADLIRNLARQGRTVIFSSHLLTQAENLCDRIALLGEGRLLAEGSPTELLGESARAPARVSRLEEVYLEKVHGR